MTTIEDVMALAEELRCSNYNHIPAQAKLHAAIERYAAERVAAGCNGVGDPECNYLSGCRTPCNKCGRVHRHHMMIARAQEWDRLIAERDSLSLAYKTSEDDVFNLTQKVIPNLRAERDALQADAARYRWLRDMDEDPVCSLAAMWTDCKGSAHSISKRVDAAVDAHRGKNTT